MAIVNDKGYIDRINKLKTEIWLDGKKITGKISEHPKFRGIIYSQARLFDIQNRKGKSDIMTYVSPTTGNKVGMSFLEPKTKEDLEKRRKMFQEWAKSNAGMMGRSPDYMNTILMVLNSCSGLFELQDEQCVQNIKAYYEHVRENDLTLTHVFVKPQNNRSEQVKDKSHEITSARVVKKTKDGIVIKGARILATQAGITDEILVYPTGANITDESFAYAFAIPSDTPGLKFYCRESFVYDDSSFNHPLGSNFDEIDAIVVFDNVLVPWDRVFLHGNLFLNQFLYSQSNFFEHVAHQVVSKNVIKTEFILGVIQNIVDTLNISEYQHIREKVSEVVIALEAMKGFLLNSEHNAKINQWGVMTPDQNPLLAAVNYYPRVYPRLIEIIQLISASGLITIPNENDFNSEIKEDLNHYLKSTNRDGYERVKLFRLAWDLAGSAFSNRQKLYERFFFGDPVRLASDLYERYNRKNSNEFVRDFLNKY